MHNLWHYIIPHCPCNQTKTSAPSHCNVPGPFILILIFLLLEQCLQQHGDKSRECLLDKIEARNIRVPCEITTIFFQDVYLLITN
uniref:Importin beta-1 n=1 Tax=Rhizophora mucronata TaxID=61149 RepID=A0A2P2MIP7_RHIMU